MNNIWSYIKTRITIFSLCITLLALVIYCFTASIDFTPFYLTFKLAIYTTVLLLLIGIPIGYFLAFSKWRGKVLLESILSLPIILPPTVLGYYFITVMGPNSSIGRFFEDTLGLQLIFSFEGILLGSMIYCLPFMINPITNGFRSLPKSMIESTQLLGKSKLNALWHVLLPNTSGSILGAILLTFAHTIGEFGVVLMIGGNLPETKVASIAIYDEMNQLNYVTADTYAVILLGFSFVLIFAINLMNRSNRAYLA
jgi:molybdate transport system permease protein